MAEDATPSPPPAAPPPARRRPWRWLGGGMALLVALVAGAIVAVVWAVHDARGSAWLLTLVPRLTIVAPEGSLIGDFAARRIDITLPGTSGVLRLDAPRWHALGAARGDHGRWLRLTIATLHADRVVLLPGEHAGPVKSEATAPPETLRLPVEIEIGEASVDELRFGADADAAATTLRGLRGRVHLGADGGARHRFDALVARHENQLASGSALIGADAPFAVGARLALASVDSAPAWQASASGDGALDALNVTATARVAATPTHPAQSLDARALVRPFAAWPLGELHLATEALDLSAFTSAAPATALSGQAIATTSGMDRPALVSVELRNARAGRWNEGLLPLRQLRAELRARPDDPSVLEVQTLAAELGAAGRGGGQIAGRGRWTRERWNVDLDLDKLNPLALDARAPETSLDGKVSIVGTGFGAAAPGGRAAELVADLSGRIADRFRPRAAPALARLRMQARASELELVLRSAEASVGEARATLAGRLTRTAAGAPWHAAGQAALVDFDPAVWWPGAADSLLARGANRLNATGEFDFALPAALNAAPPADALAALRGAAKITLAASTLAGVPLEGSASFVNRDGTGQPALDVVAAGNRLRAQGRIGASAARDSWQIAVDAPQLARLSPLVRAPGAPASAPAALAGSLAATARLDGRWPDLTSEGELHGSALRYDTIVVRQAEGRWRIGSAADAKVEAQLAVDGMDIAGRAVEQLRARVAGTARAHSAEIRVESAALPPPWVDTLAASRSAKPVGTIGAPGASAAVSVAASASARASAAPSASASTPSVATTATGRSALTVNVEGGLVDAGASRAAGWSGRLRELTARSTADPERIWLRAAEIRGNVYWGDGPARASVEPGSAEALGATLRWSRVAWQGRDAQGRGARLDAHGTVDPLPVAPVLRLLQPDFGWGGDLTMGARIDMRSAPSVAVDVVVERARGDLSVTDETGTQNLGVSELRFGVAAKDGVWNFTTALAGSALGVASGTVTARTGSAAATWPDAATSIAGTVEVRVANLGTWGRWVPAGWRLGGELRANATVGGRFGAPQYTGRIEGSKLGVRNFVQGVNVTDGDVAIALRGATAHIERFSARGGSGRVSLEGDASFGAAPAAQLRLKAERFEMLGRVDRRIVVSGGGALLLDAKSLALDGDFGIDEGLFDFTRADAPSLGADVEVVRRPRSTPVAPAGAALADEPKSPLPPPAARKVALDLRVAMGDKLRIRGRGLDAGLRGELHLTSPGGRLAVNGTVRAVDGTYQAYGQKLGIDRGVLVFSGPLENPRLDIEATRPNLDVRVGVVVAGTALNPRVRLFSEPEMSDIDKLSWLVLGRASEGVGQADTALLQSAALALLSGEGPGLTDRLTRAIGLDALTVRQQNQGEVKETIVSLGKQLSKRWYVGYERGVNATTGSWQLIYRVAQRVTVRAQAGGDNSLDLIWTLRWK